MLDFGCAPAGRRGKWRSSKSATRSAADSLLASAAAFKRLATSGGSCIVNAIFSPGGWVMTRLSEVESWSTTRRISNFRACRPFPPCARERSRKTGHRTVTMMRDPSCVVEGKKWASGPVGSSAQRCRNGRQFGGVKNWTYPLFLRPGIQNPRALCIPPPGPGGVERQGPQPGTPEGVNCSGLSWGVIPVQCQFWREANLSYFTTAPTSPPHRRILRRVSSPDVRNRGSAADRRR
jgi:hypothetical protein